MVRKIYRFLSSARLAMVLFVAILVCCVTGVTIYRGEEAGSRIFSTLWFNALLVMLVVNVAFCFFPRMWGRKLTFISTGMILFHFSFVAILGGIVYNSLFYFRGMIRLTEGETLPNGKLETYDFTRRGRFFDLTKLKGETKLIRMHTNYRVDGENKRVAYEIAVGEKNFDTREIIYITKHLDYRGFRYFCDREGYTVLVVLYDKLRKELYGGYYPLQSLKQKDGSYLYTTGTKDGPQSIPYPYDRPQPLISLQAAYHPSKIKERGGEAFFQVWPIDEMGRAKGEKPLAEGKAPLGEMFDAGDYYLSLKEVRYWTAMFVRYDPGLPIVLASLWMGLVGMVITFVGRLRQGKRQPVGEQQPAVSDQVSS